MFKNVEVVAFDVGEVVVVVDVLPVVFAEVVPPVFDDPPAIA